MEGGAGGGNSDVELLSRTLQVEHKLFYFDLKENPRGRYLKISEKTAATRSTIIVPVAGIVYFLDLFNYYVDSVDQDLFSKELQLDTKVPFFTPSSPRRFIYLFADMFLFTVSSPSFPGLLLRHWREQERPLPQGICLFPFPTFPLSNSLLLLVCMSIYIMMCCLFFYNCVPPACFDTLCPNFSEWLGTEPL